MPATARSGGGCAVSTRGCVACAATPSAGTQSRRSSVPAASAERRVVRQSVVRGCWLSSCIRRTAKLELPVRASLSIRWTVREGVTCIFRRALHGAPVPFVIVISARQRWAPAIAVAIGRGDFQHPRIAEPAAGGLVTRHANALLQPRQRCGVAVLGAQCARAGLGLRVLVHIKSEEHTSELQSLMRRSYAVFCLK